MCGAVPRQGQHAGGEQREEAEPQNCKTDANRAPISGVTFTVNKADSSTLTTVKTDANGEALLTALDPGVYVVRETSVPDGYLLDSEAQFITLVPNKTGTVRFRNYPKPTLTIDKVDSYERPYQGRKVPHHLCQQ